MMMRVIWAHEGWGSARIVRIILLLDWLRRGVLSVVGAVRLDRGISGVVLCVWGVGGVRGRRGRWWRGWRGGRGWVESWRGGWRSASWGGAASRGNSRHGSCYNRVGGRAPDGSSAHCASRRIHVALVVVGRCYRGSRGRLRRRDRWGVSRRHQPTLM